MPRSALRKIQLSWIRVLDAAGEIDAVVLVLRGQAAAIVDLAVLDHGAVGAPPDRAAEREADPGVVVADVDLVEHRPVRVDGRARKIVVPRAAVEVELETVARLAPRAIQIRPRIVALWPGALVRVIPGLEIFSSRKRNVPDSKQPTWPDRAPRRAPGRRAGDPRGSRRPNSSPRGKRRGHSSLPRLRSRPRRRGGAAPRGRRLRWEAARTHRTGHRPEAAAITPRA